jgi:FkbM family methyltransferase
MKKFVNKLFPVELQRDIHKKFIKPFFNKYKQSYSQCGEDMILDVIFGKKKGFYIDVGANNPVEQSNTMYLYKKGWSGINIDATPGSMKRFNRLRKRDINLEIAISSEEKSLTFYMFNPSFYNTFEKRISVEYKDRLIGVKEIKTTPLSKVLDKHLGDKIIDFLTIDVEGYDLDILKSNNWEKYRPKVVLIEFLCYSQGEITSNIHDFLVSCGYKFLCNTPTNAFFIENTFFINRFNKTN